MNTIDAWRAPPARPESFDRTVANINRVLYPLWGAVILYRETALALTLASLSRPGEGAGNIPAMSNAGLLAGTMFAVGEMFVTAALFGRGLVRYQGTHTDIERYRPAYVGFVDAMMTERVRAMAALPDPAVDVGPVEVDDAQREASMLTTPLLAASQEDDKASAAPDLTALLEGYAGYRAAVAAIPAGREQFRGDALAFARDTVVQGGAAGCNLALLWHSWDIARLLNLSWGAISVPAATIGGAVSSILMGVLHIAAAAVSWTGARKLLSLAKRAHDAVANLTLRILHANHMRPPSQHDDYVAALPVCEALLHHAGRNEDAAVRAARNQIFAAKLRLAFGCACVILGGVSLTLLLVLGAVSTGGILVGMAALLAGLAWLVNAAIKSQQHAAALNAAVRAPLEPAAQAPAAATSDASGEAACAGPCAAAPAVMPLQQAILQAVDLLDGKDGMGSRYPEGRKLVKRLLRDLGVPREDFWPLKRAPAEIRDRVRAELAATIHRYVAGDAMRRAFADPPA